MIKAQALIDKFRYALDNHWGYIWGTAGDPWTAAKQKLKVNYMIKNFGENWKKNADAKDNKYYSSALYGDKWIGHVVADCSGVFRWAFAQLGGSVSHNSNTIYRQYCTSQKGVITDSIRKNLLPGTAVFVYKKDKDSYSHIGLYVGNGKVIEAAGTQAGVCTSNITAGKWTYYGRLKNVDYSDETPSETPSSTPVDEIPTTNLPTLKRGSTGEYVTLLQTKLKNAGYDLGKYGVDGDFGSATLAAVKKFQKDHGLTADGIVGKQTWAALESGKPADLYSVVIPHLTAEQANSVIASYPGAYKEIEKG